jgi:hypothetical protein
MARTCILLHSKNLFIEDAINSGLLVLQFNASVEIFSVISTAVTINS